MKKKLFAVAIAVGMTMMPVVPSMALLLNHRVDCYGLDQCKTPKLAAAHKCISSKGGFYLVLKKRECKKLGGHS